VLSPLGEGGMGTVYLCEHAVLHRKLAVKVLRSSYTSDPELVDRFRNEAIAASRIGQENVVDVLDFGTAEDGALYYVMEALQGESLGSAIRQQGAFEVRRALGLLEQICRALAAAHARGVVHRDVKPDNVFLVRRDDGSELAKVIDFGISHVPRPEGVAPITRSGAIIGTPEYMAPEQAAGEPVDRRSDVYAVGVLAFEMLTGELPIEAATPIATLVAHQTRTPDPPSRRRPVIPPEVDGLVLRALAKRPEDRFASMDELAAEVTRVRGLLARTTKPFPPRPSQRGETVALPDGRDDVRRATRRVQRAMPMAIAMVVAAGLALTAWILARELKPVEAARQVPAAAATPAATPTPTATTTATPIPTATAAPAPASAEATTPAAPVRAPVLVGEPASPPPPARAKRPARATRAKEDGAEDLKDPYSTGGDLKDPFK
jgi:serine/threonine protein kinase